MNKFWELLEKSVIVSGILAIAVVGAIVYLAVVGQPIPEILTALGGTIVGFFFGAKKQQVAAYAARLKG